jgi:Uma2 family endonuclease
MQRMGNIFSLLGDIMATTEHKSVTARVRLGPRAAGKLMTPEEFDATPESAWDDRFRYELINGVLVVTPLPANAEVDPNEELGYLLRSYQEYHPRGASLNLTLPERIVPTTNRRRADRVVWAGLGRIPDTETEAPAIVIEFVSASRRDQQRDYEAKRSEYLAIGVREYWIIDRFQRKMTVCRNRPAGIVEVIVPETETYETELLPGLVLPLARLLAKADRWPPKKRPRLRRPPAGGAN